MHPPAPTGEFEGAAAGRSTNAEGEGGCGTALVAPMSQEIAGKNCKPLKNTGTDCNIAAWKMDENGLLSD